LILSRRSIKIKKANIGGEERGFEKNAFYSNWFKAKHNIVGVVFKGRYKSILADENNYGYIFQYTFI